jgi:hypothetical protein
MAEAKKPRKRIVDRPEKRKIEDPVRISPAIERRTAGILGYYAKTRGVSEAVVVETALSQLFEGWKITDPGNVVQGEAAA